MITYQKKTTTEKRPQELHSHIIGGGGGENDDCTGDREYTYESFHACSQCNEIFKVISYLHDISKGYYQMIRERHIQDPDCPPFDNAEDLHFEKTRGLCSECLDMKFGIKRGGEEK